MSYRCTFIHTPNTNFTRNQSYGLEFMPTWVFTLASHIPTKGIQLDFYDLRFDALEQVSEADVFLFSGINQDLEELLNIRSHLQQVYPNCKCIIGGPICWSFNESNDLDLLSAFDHIFIGEGEDAIGDLVVSLSEKRSVDHVIHNKHRFDLNRSLYHHEGFVNEKLHRYYGVVIEVSRGCPFLCEFCDIRIMPDNNKAWVRPVAHIIEEMERSFRAGKSQFIFACDNFIGDLVWAEELVDAIIEMNDRIGHQSNLYTWLTINAARHPRLLQKMRRAGFDLLFVGIESFNVNSLIETAKVQNTKRDMVEDIQLIQSYGFIIIAGLIFGFDTDEEDTFEVALSGLKDSGLLSGDPSFLVALPGTPLYRRIKLAGRLRTKIDMMSGSHTGGSKYVSNIRYLLPTDQLISGFQSFVKKFGAGRYQYQRLKNYYRAVLSRDNYIPLKKENSGFANVGDVVTILFKDKQGWKQLMRRIISFARAPGNIYYTIAAFYFVVFKVNFTGKFNHFRYWLFSWSSHLMKYNKVSADEFDFESVEGLVSSDHILPRDYAESADEDIPQTKTNAQLRSTIKGLERIISKKALKPLSEEIVDQS